MTSRLDSNHAPLYNIPNCPSANKLQRVQNWAARFVVRGEKYDYVSPKELYWLLEVKRTQFEILLLCYRCLNGSAPRHLTSLPSPHKLSRNLRSNRGVLKLTFHDPNDSGVTAPFLLQHLASGIICPSKSGLHLRLMFSKLY